MTLAAQLEKLKELSDELGMPGQKALLAAARREGLNLIKIDHVKNLLSGSGAKAIFKPLNASVGKTVASGENSRWMMDLFFHKVEWKKYVPVLVIVDVFSRKVWAKPVEDKTPEKVRDALSELLDEIGEKPAEISSDLGNEFAPPVKTFLTGKDIVLRQDVAKYDRNAHSLIDNKIQKIKTRIARLLSVNAGMSWVDVLPKAVQAQNKLVSEPLHGAPNDVKTDSVRSFMITQDMARYERIRGSRS